MLKIYRKADVYILPSFHEGMPHTVWEAFSQQTPVIVTKVGGLRDNFRHLEDVIFIEPYSVSDIVNALYLIEKDETLRNKLVANGLSYVKFATAERQALEMYNAYIKFFKQP